MTGLNWLREQSLLQENEDKQKGNNRDSYCVASLPRDMPRA